MVGSRNGCGGAWGGAQGDCASGRAARLSLGARRRPLVRAGGRERARGASVCPPTLSFLQASFWNV